MPLPESMVSVVVSSVAFDDYKKHGKIIIDRPFPHNQGIILVDEINNKKSLLGRYNVNEDAVVKLLDGDLNDWKPTSKEMRLLYDYIRNQDNLIIAVVGEAGTGKTSTAINFGLHFVLNEKKYEGLVIIKPIVEIGRSLGYLPGDLDEKTAPHMESYEDAISKFTYTNLESLRRDGKVEVLISQFARGRDLKNRFVIIDEAQNFDVAELGALLSRFADDCRVVVLGDLRQCDVRGMTLAKNGLYQLIESEYGKPYFGFVELKRNMRGRISQVGAQLARKGSQLDLDAVAK